MNKFSKKLNVQLIAEVLSAFGIEHIVLSPGSRNGALATHFTYHQKFKTYSIVDERSAGFVALGIAQRLRKPVVVCCTSGSAVVNYYPAVVEAFYQNIPLIVLSADRPEYLIDNFDGQTIRQKNVFENHSYCNVQLSENEDNQSLTDNLSLIKKAISESFHNFRPVHINMPFSEPLYEFQDKIEVSIDKIEIPVKPKETVDFEDLRKNWNQLKNKLILVGLQYPDEKFNDLLGKLSDDDSVVVLTETTSNVHSPRFFSKIDQIIFSLNKEELENLKPDLLITLGQNVVSKKVKSFLRNHKAVQHWHVDEFWQPDTYQILTHKIKLNPIDFLMSLNPNTKKSESDYYQKWNSIRKKREIYHNKYLSEIPFSDFKVFEVLIQKIPENWQIHYSNSSVIRYTQLFDAKKETEIFCNRGTSGIDGSLSTSAGSAMVCKNPTVLITGDVSFFYDSNGMWNQYLPKNYRIILINNGGGNIFKIIPGPENSGVVESVFETPPKLSSKHLAKLYGFDFYKACNLEELHSALNDFFDESENPKLLEIDTSKVENAQILRDYYKNMI